MTLQKRRCHFPVDITFHRATHDGRLMFTRCQNRNFARRQNGCDAHGNGFARYIRLAKKIGGRISSRDVVEVHQPRATGFARARLVESDVAGFADAKNLKINSARGENLFFVGTTRFINLVARHRSRRHMDVGRTDVDVRKQILPHVPVIRVHTVHRHWIIFVEIESYDIPKRQSFVLMPANQFAVHANRCRSGREAEHRHLSKRGARLNNRRHSVSNQSRNVAVCFNNDCSNAFTLGDRRTHSLVVVEANFDFPHVRHVTSSTKRYCRSRSTAP